MNFLLSKPKAFTLVEMLIVVFIIAALVAILGPAQQYIFKDTEKTSMQADARGITNAAAQYLAEHDSLPVTNVPVTVSDDNVEHIIKEQLVTQGVSDTLFTDLNGVAFKEIDEKAISSYIKGDKSNVNNYFIVDKVDNLNGYNNNLLGYVFTMEAYATHDGKVYSGEFAAITQPDGPTVTPEPWKSMGYVGIGKPEELDAIRNHVGADGAISGKYVLVNDIDMSEFQNFKPIGKYSTSQYWSFTGTFEGNGKKITRLNITQADGHGVGLFSRIAGGTIQNLTIEANIDLTNVATTYNHVGILGGYAEAYNGNITISNVHVSGDIIASKSYNIGGLLGMAKGGSTLQITIDNSSYNGSVTGKDDVGGFVGSVYMNVGITNSHSAGSVSGVTRVGGFVGEISTIQTIPFTDNYSTANVSGRTGAWIVGGFAGDMSYTTMSRNYATGNVTSLGTSSDIGGFAGLIVSSSIVSDSYARGDVNGPSAAGFVGRFENSTLSNSYSTGLVTGSGTLGGFASKIYTVTSTSNYWDVTTSGVSTSAAGTGMTTPQMKQQATFTGWDFTNIWSIDETLAYPILR